VVDVASCVVVYGWYGVMAPTGDDVRTYVFNMRKGYSLIVYVWEDKVKIYLGREVNGVEVLFLQYEIHGNGRRV
jgi:hypothetical protein